MHDKSKFDVLLSYSLVVHRFEEYKACGISQGRGVKEKQKKWRPPGRGVFKLNCDGAYVPETRVGGADVVIHIDKGKIAVAQTIPLSSLTTPKYVEILAISYGVTSCIRLRLFTILSWSRMQWRKFVKFLMRVNVLRLMSTFWM